MMHMMTRPMVSTFNEVLTTYVGARVVKVMTRKDKYGHFQSPSTNRGPNFGTRRGGSFARETKGGAGGVGQDWAQFSAQMIFWALYMPVLTTVTRREK